MSYVGDAGKVLLNLVLCSLFEGHEINNVVQIEVVFDEMGNS